MKKRFHTLFCLFLFLPWDNKSHKFFFVSISHRKNKSMILKRDIQARETKSKHQWIYHEVQHKKKKMEFSNNFCLYPFRDVESFFMLRKKHRYWIGSILKMFKMLSGKKPGYNLNSGELVLRKDLKNKHWNTKTLQKDRRKNEVSNPIWKWIIRKSN